MTLASPGRVLQQSGIRYGVSRGGVVEVGQVVGQRFDKHRKQGRVEGQFRRQLVNDGAEFVAERAGRVEEVPQQFAAILQAMNMGDLV